MSTFKNLQAAEATLARYVPAVRKITGQQITLERIAPLMERLGNPQNKLKIIHLAGTSGKTSTAYYLASLLQTNGHKVGLTISPHVDSITERLQINLEPLSEREFCDALGEFMDLIQAAQPEPTYFELMVAFAYWYFAKAKVDYAVIETGLGGLHDGTNIAQQADKVCVITDIGFDHMHVLGTTLDKIAAQKAGIIHPKNQVFMYRQSPEVTEVFVRRAAERDAVLNLLEQSELSKQYALRGLDYLPLYQQRNWLLSRRVGQYVADRDGWALDDVTTSLAVQVPGRMESWQAAGKTVLMDGAHNEQKMRAFIDSFQRKYPDTKTAILLSLKEGKEYEAVLPLLRPICNRLIITTYDHVQDVPIPAIRPEVLADAARALGFANVEAISDSQSAYQALLESPEALVVITGSFYLLGSLRPLILKA